VTGFGASPLPYWFYWRRKTRLLLITGDEAAIEQLVPGLQQQQWLEGNRTVLIYGGSLASEPDREKYTALRKLRRGRPLDGIVRVMPQSLNLTPQISDSDLRGLEKSANCCVIPPRSGCGNCATATGRRVRVLSRR
jgi:type VI secretion system protein ImpL